MTKPFFEQVYREVRKVPSGKVATYGQIAAMLGSKDARRVGWALHANRDRETPCHRVVDKEGKLALNFALGGAEEQKRRLLSEKVGFKDEMHVDLEKCKWKIKR